ncbi:sortase-like acyltransferase [Jimgerdemannia flammicorona]|uniref:Sortase-like acyltransferase n=1 Tax=Jimgerdemannia flammicorona TaxID=994334 RepID=A0A433Q7I7_9FUNG|nr:sortase-like acyltransferase [Jimgerdemannia flammicorona]
MPSPPPYQLRSGTEQDLPAILEIFNHEVRTTTSLYLQDPVTLANRKAWFDGLRDGGYPFIVATAREGEGGEEEEVVGYSTLNTFRDTLGFNTVEVSLYIHRDHRGRGLGHLLTREIIRLGKERGYHTIIAGICTENSASLSLYKSHGFREVGVFRESGFKSGRWMSTAFYQLML